nr:MAG TPA: hypothetical protein [Caudoviricetes sp.]
MVPVWVCSVCILAVALVMRLLMSVLVWYISLNY